MLIAKQPDKKCKNAKWIALEYVSRTDQEVGGEVSPVIVLALENNWGV